MNIFFKEIRTNLKSLIIWCGVTVLFNVIGFAKFSAYYGNPQLMSVLDAMPKAVIDAFSLRSFNLSTLTGFFGLLFVYSALLVCIAAVMWGTDIISKEERDKTVEFALTLPVKRSQVITAKALAMLVNCVVLLLVTWAVSLLNATAYQPDPLFYQFASLSVLALFIMQMIFLAIGVFLGCAMKHYKQAGSLAISVLLLTYLFSVLSDMNQNLEFLKYISPFKYFNPLDILNNLAIDANYVFLSLAIIVVFMAGAYLTYSKRDLYI